MGFHVPHNPIGPMSIPNLIMSNLPPTQLALFEFHRAEYLDRARQAAVELYHQRGPITVNDVREVCPPPDGMDGRVMGAIFSTRQWRCVGYGKSDRRECHGRPVGRFEYTEHGPGGSTNP